MSYSRRQLYALGEPLGDSVTRAEGGRIVYGDGGGGGGDSTSTQTQTTDLPDWAKPYAKDILSKGAALSDTEKNPYQTFSGQRVAGFQPLQEQAFKTVGGMDAGPEGFQKNMSSYMSPYMQNVVDIEKREAGRQSGIMGTQQQAQATQAGAFGGARDALQRAERERNLSQQMGDIQTRGSQAAYESAANQFRQGITQQSGLAQLQGTMGAQQQQQAQRPMDVAYQDFLNQQNYPYKQLGFMSDLLRGTPTGSSSTVNMYQPAASPLQSLAGIGMGAYGLSKMGMFADGGMIGAEEPVIRYADGGEIKTYAGDQGSVTSEYNIADIIDKLGPEQLQQARENALHRRDMNTVDAIDKRLAELAQSKSLYAGLGGAFDQIDPEQQEAMMAGGGIVAFANGGSYLDRAEKAREEQLGFIDQATTMPSPEDRRKDIVTQRDMIKGLYEPSVLPKYLEETKAERANLGKNMDEARGLGALLAAAEMVGARNIREGARASTKAFVGEVSRVAKENKEADRLLRQSEIQLATASELYNNGMTDKAIAEADKGRTAKARAAELKAGVAGDTSKMYAQLQNTQLGKDATIAAANISAKTQREIANKPGQLERMVSDYEKRIGRKLTADEYVQATEKMGAASYGAKYTGPDKSLEQATGIQKLIKDDPRVGAVELELLMAKGDPVKTAQLEQKLATITAEVQQEVINRAKNIKDKSGAPADVSRVGKTPDPEAVNILKSAPSAQNRKYFDDVYGAGAAARVLGN